MEHIQNIHNKLREELLTKRSTVYSDALNFSVGEIINLYKDEDIDLEPAFQRLFRWSSEQQSKFIESLLLGYPVPAIFVYQKDDGVWDVVDGVQRISSLLNFAGLLNDNEALILENTEILEELTGKLWDEEIYKRIINDSNFEAKKYAFEKNELSYIDSASLRDLKRARIPVIVLDNRSASISKYELFKRLNTGGSKLTPQETRNALILMTNEIAFKAIKNFSNSEAFKLLINVDDSDIKVAFDMEIVTRYIILANKDKLVTQTKKESIEHFIDRNIENILKNHSSLLESQLNKFETIITFLSKNLSENYAFRKYDASTGKFYGQFSWLIFETVIYGLLEKISILESENFIQHETLATKIKNISWPNIQGMRVPERMLEFSSNFSKEALSDD